MGRVEDGGLGVAHPAKRRKVLLKVLKDSGSPTKHVVSGEERLLFLQHERNMVVGVTRREEDTHACSLAAQHLTILQTHNRKLLHQSFRIKFVNELPTSRAFWRHVLPDGYRTKMTKNLWHSQNVVVMPVRHHNLVKTTTLLIHEFDQILQDAWPTLTCVDQDPFFPSADQVHVGSCEREWAWVPPKHTSNARGEAFHFWQLRRDIFCRNCKSPQAAASTWFGY
mmetsp:Transcript_27820/g.73493  ORF Transcript_27820/g.73493 Transcript_27820/m.73493 type:complete len:224 (-) Transcript_27820:143-814(-)